MRVQHRLCFLQRAYEFSLSSFLYREICIL